MGRHHRHNKKGRRYARTIRYFEQRGAMNEWDPAWLLENTTLDEIELWLTTLMDHRFERCSQAYHSYTLTGRSVSELRPLFNEKERHAIESMNDQYDRMHVKGFHDRPLTGRQLLYLRILWDRLGQDSRILMQKEAAQHAEVKR